MKERSQPMGFWKYPSSGRYVWGNKLMAQLLKEQRLGETIADSSLLDLNAGDLSHKYPLEILPGHAAWLDWPYKLHRIQSESGDLKLELYNLEEDPKEQNNLILKNNARAKLMTPQIELWQKSVVNSLNGDDYH